MPAPISSLAIVLASTYLGVQMVSNIASLKIGLVAGLAVDLGTFLYPLSFTLRDAVHRALGKRGSRILVLTSAALCLAMSLYLALCAVLPAAPEWGDEHHQAFSLIFSPVWRIVVASIVAMTLSELLDTELFQRFAYGSRPLAPWLASLLSNFASIPLDNLIFAFGAFGGVLPTHAVWQIFLFNLLLKAVVSLVALPILFLQKPTQS